MSVFQPLQNVVTVRFTVRFRALHYNEVSILQKLMPIVPSRESSIRIHTQYPAQLSVRILFPEYAQRIDCV